MWVFVWWNASVVSTAELPSWFFEHEKSRTTGCHCYWTSGLLILQIFHVVVETVQVWSLFLMYLVRQNQELMKFCLEILAFHLNVERFLFLLLFYAIFNHFHIFLLYNPEESGDFPAWALRNELSLAQCLYSLVSKRICGKSCDCLTLAICYSSQTLRVSVRCSTIEPRQCWILRVQNQSDSIYNKAIFSLLSLFSEHPMLPLSDWIVQSGSCETLLVQQNHGVKRNVLHWQDQVTCMEGQSA